MLEHITGVSHPRPRKRSLFHESAGRPLARGTVRMAAGERGWRRNEVKGEKVVREGSSSLYQWYYWSSSSGKPQPLWYIGHTSSVLSALQRVPKLRRENGKCSQGSSHVLEPVWKANTMCKVTKLLCSWEQLNLLPLKSYTKGEQLLSNHLCVTLNIVQGNRKKWRADTLRLVSEQNIANLCINSC